MFDASNQWYRQQVSTVFLPPPPERPTYTAADASRWAQTTPRTTRRWLDGYEYPNRGGRRSSPLVSSRTPGERFLTFYDLVEVAAIAKAVRNGVSIPRIRAALDYAAERFRTSRPLLHERFKTDGYDLYLHEFDPDLHVNASRAGQIAFPYISEVLRDLEYENEVAVRWYPAGPDKPILVDPRLGFGQPIVLPAGIRTEVLNDRFVAGEDAQVIADDYGLRVADVLEAVRFENKGGVVAD